MHDEAAASWAIAWVHVHLVAISFFGGLVLFGLRMAEHFSRPDREKLPTKKYVVFFVSQLIILPGLGAGVAIVYLMNGDKLSPLLALQVGLTSPAIVQSLVINGSNSMRRSKRAPASPRAKGTQRDSR